MAFKSAFYFAMWVASISAIAVHGSSNSEEICVYTMYVRTGLVFKAGTDSNISLALGDAQREKLVISNLVAWGGLMGKGYDYYEMGNLDIFSGRGPCLSGPICSMDLISDGTGPHHGWFCNYVEVTSTGPHTACNQRLFTVNQWLATDAPPYELTFSNDQCATHQTQGHNAAM